MIDPISGGLALLGALGRRKSNRDAQRQAEAQAAAQNRELMAFMDRNDERAAEAGGVFSGLMAEMQPGAMDARRGAATDERRGAMFDAIMSAGPRAAPMRASAAGIMAPEVAATQARETGRVKDMAGASARVSGFGDLVFGNNLLMNNAGRRIGMVNDFGAADAAMLAQMQELAGGEAALRKRPSPIGGILEGAANLGAAYMGSR